jgi:error-prone DNA polymerase
MAILRPEKSFAGCRKATELESYRQGQFVRIAGIVTGRQRPGTATGVLFLTLEDETDNMNVVVWSSVLTQFRAALLQGQLLKIKGIVEREESVIHVIAGHIEDMTHELSALANQPKHQKNHQKTKLKSFKSRDFR